MHCGALPVFTTGKPCVQQVQAYWMQSLLLQMQAALRLTSAQQADMLLMRKLYYAKCEVLRYEREQLWPQVPVEVPRTAADAATKMMATTTIAQQLQDSSTAEFRATLQFGSAFERGVGPRAAAAAAALAVKLLLTSAAISCHCVPMYAVTGP